MKYVLFLMLAVGLVGCEAASWDLVHDSSNADCILENTNLTKPYTSKLVRHEMPDQYYFRIKQDGKWVDKIIGEFEDHPLFEGELSQGYPQVHIFKTNKCELFIEWKEPSPIMYIIDEARVKEIYNHKIKTASNERGVHVHAVPGKILAKNYSSESGIFRQITNDMAVNEERRDGIGFLFKGSWVEYSVSYDHSDFTHDSISLSLRLDSEKYGGLVNIMVDGEKYGELNIQRHQENRGWINVSTTLPAFPQRDTIQAIRFELASIHSQNASEHLSLSEIHLK